jgi:chromosome segregation ATPase
MNSQRVDKLNTILEEIKNTGDDQVAKKLELDKCKRIINRLSSFSSDCEECNQHLINFEKHIFQVNDKRDHLTESDFKQHKQTLGDVSSHLQKQHKLVTSGHYLSIYMSMGISLGVVFGLVIFDNIGLGIPIGISVGLAIGAGLDADAKKKGMII